MADGVPVVYVRGFAGQTSGINTAVDDPFYGFNSGSTHVRVGGGGEPVFYQFESPLLRLMIDHGYDLFVKGGQVAWLTAQPDGSVPATSIWIHRFYDRSASTWGERPEDFRLERAAEDLLTLIKLIRAKTGAPRVHLVAHSMGGLICRCLIQKIIPDRAGTQLGVGAAADVIDRFFTYATPHGGIEFSAGFGLVERLRDAFGIAGADIFGPRRMWEYLTPGGDAGRPPRGWTPREMPAEAFPKARLFTLVGTNPGDYDVGLGIPARAVGVKSDGLVQIENATVVGAPAAYVHRSHSGRYGIVNSEEGYQNLRRFLFADVEVDAALVNLQLPERRRDTVWQADAELSVRGLPVLMHGRSAAHHCPIDLGQAADDIPLAATYLFMADQTRPEGAGFSRFSLHVRLFALEERRGIFDFGNHLELSADFDDQLIVDVGTQSGDPAVWAQWVSAIPRQTRDYLPQGAPLSDDKQEKGLWEATVLLPSAARSFLGADAAVRLTARPHP